MTKDKQSKGYKKFVRPSGLPWYLCDFCEEVACVSNDEQRLIDHVREKHEM